MQETCGRVAVEAHWYLYPPVVVHDGLADIDVPDGAAAGLEAAGGAQADEQVGVEGLDGQVGGERRGHGAHLIHAVHRAFTCAKA